MASRPVKKHPRKRTCRFLVSACLAGVHCTYNGNTRLDRRVGKLVDRRVAVPVCPEVLGGGAVPRERCEISGGDGNDVLEGRAAVLTPAGRDISRALLRGAKKALGLARRYGIRAAIMKSKSPSCGCGRIYDGSFRRRLIKGDGVTTALLRRGGIAVYTERKFPHA